MNTLFLLLVSLSSFAQSPTTSSSNSLLPTTQSTQKVLKNKKFADDKDITDPVLKVESGSRSRYSMKFSLAYFGPPIGDITNERQPNPDGTIDNRDTALSGSISFRHRLNPKSALSFGTGINSLTPFHGSKRTDVKTPFASYDHNSRIGDVQMRNSYEASVTTVKEYLDVGQFGSVGYGNSLIYDIGTSGYALGLDSSASLFLYNRDYETRDRAAGRYFVGFFPRIKYNVNDKFNVYTSFAFGFHNPRELDDELAWQPRTVTGRVGGGYAFTRDIYFSSFLNFYPGNLRTDSTTISFSTVFSIL